MTFTIEDTDDDVDYSPTPLREEDRAMLQQQQEQQFPPQPDMTIVLNAFPDDHFLVTEKQGLLGDRVIGTLGFCGALALLASTCCCCCRGCHRDEIASTFNRHTLFGMCCSFS
jgi:hypothetical protein